MVLEVALQRQQLDLVRLELLVLAVALEGLAGRLLSGRGRVLLVAGARPEAVRGAVLCDGPGLAGGGPAPQSPLVITAPAGPVDTELPDPYALLELARDVRPEDYATTYARQALQFSGLEAPLAVAAVVRPPWLAAVAAEPGVVSESLAEALARFAATA